MLTTKPNPLYLISRLDIKNPAYGVKELYKLSGMGFNVTGSWDAICQILLTREIDPRIVSTEAMKGDVS